MRWLFFLILVIRIFNALSIRTFFQLDEYYQALEPLYYLVFGHGVLTWEWEHQLRSFVHPLIFSVVYKICDIFQLQDVWIRLLPKILQLILSSIGEYHIYLLLLKITHQYKIALITIFLSLTSPFNWYFITRTFSNNLEMILTVVALNYFPIRHNKLNWKKYIFSLVLALVSCIIRPTNAFIWICLGLELLFKSDLRLRISLVTSAVVISVMSLNSVVDFIFYQKLTFPIWNFLQFNVLSELSSFYGVNSLSFYFVQAIPVIMTTFVPFMLLGIYQVYNSRNLLLRRFLLLCIANIALFSLVAHKEFRFVYPMMPFFMIFSSFGYVEVSKYFQRRNWNLIISILLIVNFVISYYMVRIHESGVITVVDFLKTELTENSSVGFLTPCHSTPYQSYFNLDPNIEIWSLSCEPPLSQQELSSYQDESDIFYEDPVVFLQNLQRQWPDYIVIFDALPQITKEYLKDVQHYQEIKRIFNSRQHWDNRRNGDVIVLKHIQI